MAKLLHVVGTAANSAYEQDGRYGGEITMNGTAATLRFWAPGQTIADSNPSTNGNHNIAVTAGQVLNLSIPAGYRVTASASTLLSIDSTPYGASQLL